MRLTKEEALKYHRQMWRDMQEELGDKPTGFERVKFKGEWCEKHFPNEFIESDCFLCEYTNKFIHILNECKKCPINWGDCRGYLCPCEEYSVNWKSSPISEILALPERKEE